MRLKPQDQGKQRLSRNPKRYRNRDVIRDLHECDMHCDGFQWELRLLQIAESHRT